MHRCGVIGAMVVSKGAVGTEVLASTLKNVVNMISSSRISSGSGEAFLDYVEIFYIVSSCYIYIALLFLHNTHFPPLCPSRHLSNASSHLSPIIVP